jgi:hypothetical protein
MCLSRPKRKREVFNTTRENGYFVAYKVFDKHNKTLEFQHMNTRKEIKVKTWMFEKDYTPFYNSGFIYFGDRSYGTYFSGFHCYNSRREANKNCRYNECVKKVYLENIVQRGIQGECKVLVARKMFICGRGIK